MDYVIALSKQNILLIEEVARLKAELAKYENTQPQVKVPEPVKIKAKHPSHIESGKRVAPLNAIRKEFLENAKLNGEWIEPPVTRVPSSKKKVSPPPIPEN